MLKKLTDRKILIAAIVVLLILIGVVVFLLNKGTSQEPDDNPHNDMVEQNQDEEPYDGNGLEVKEDEEQTEEGVKAPSSWEDTTVDKENNKKDELQMEQEQSKEETAGDVSNPDTTEKTDQDSEDEGNMDSNDLPDEEQDTLWGTIF